MTSTRMRSTLTNPTRFGGNFGAPFRDGYSLTLIQARVGEAERGWQTMFAVALEAREFVQFDQAGHPRKQRTHGQ